jgi:hypothetical protein
MERINLVSQIFINANKCQYTQIKPQKSRRSVRSHSLKSPKESRGTKKV